MSFAIPSRNNLESIIGDSKIGPSKFADTTEIQLNNNNKYTQGGEKPTGLFAGLKMFFKAFIRSDTARKENESVFTQVKQDISNVFGSKVADSFDNKMADKIGKGSPLTKGALARFMKEEGLSLEPKQVLTHKIAEKIGELSQSKKNPALKSSEFDLFIKGLSTDEKQLLKKVDTQQLKGLISSSENIDKRNIQLNLNQLIS